MLSLRNFWRRHRRKLFITAGVLGSSYVLYKLYNSYKRGRADLERQLAVTREHDKLISAQLQAHFECIQRIADTTTLPHAVHCLSSRIDEELDLSLLMERLMQGKGQPNTLAYSEKLELWGRLKILSFTKMVVSLWGVTMLSLYVRVQVNILGRHLYIDTARGLESSDISEDLDLIDRDDQQRFLASADFLATYGMQHLISNMQAAVADVLKGKQLRDVFNTTKVQETIMQILVIFMDRGNPYQWLNCLIPENARFYKLATYSDIGETDLVDSTKFEQLMMETRAVLSSVEFGRVSDMSLKAVADALVNDIETQTAAGSLTEGIQLAKLLPRIIQASQSLLDEPSKNRYIQIIRRIPEVEVFFTLIYSNMPAS